jgi:serine/threonine protein kinase
MGSSLFARMESIIGPIPQWMLLQGKNSSQYFTSSRYIYETCDDREKDDEGDEDGEEEERDQMYILRPKKTNLRLRLRFSPSNELGQSFLNLIENLLIIDPNKRMTSEKALNHPFLSL